jgi:hypothetical protein
MENLFWLFIKKDAVGTVVVKGPITETDVNLEIGDIMNDGYVELHHYATQQGNWKGQDSRGQVMPPKSFFVVKGQHTGVEIRARIKE